MDANKKENIKNTRRMVDLVRAVFYYVRTNSKVKEYRISLEEGFFFFLSGLHTHNQDCCKEQGGVGEGGHTKELTLLGAVCLAAKTPHLVADILHQRKHMATFLFEGIFFFFFF